MTKIVMADYVNTDQPTGQVLTYNTTNDRGWNDPPKHVFSPVNSNRKRIDPRKRVGHDLTSTTAINPQHPPSPVPPPQQNTSPHCYMNGHAQPTFSPIPSTTNTDVAGGTPHCYMNGYAQPNFPTGPSTNENVLQHASSNPDIHKITQLPQLPSIPHCNSMPHSLDGHEQQQGVYLQPGLMSAPPKSLDSTCSPPLTGGRPSPPCRSPNESPLLGNDRSQDGRKLCAPTSNLTNSSIFNQLGTPTMLQSSHLANKIASSDTQATNSSTANLIVNSNTYQSDGQLFMPPQGPNTITNPVYPVYNNPSPQPSSLPPISLPSAVSPAGDQNNLYTRTNSLPAPPTSGFYAAGRTLNSPKGGSPNGSGPNSPVPKKDKSTVENDSEQLNETVDRLLDCRNKCACIMTNKNSEDINKKIHIFKSAWSSGKLSSTVKVQMSSLSAALQKREFPQADSIHKSLIVSHSSEVMSWMVGVKKLISSYQKVVEDNNKY